MIKHFKTTRNILRELQYLDYQWCTQGILKVLYKYDVSTRSYIATTFMTISFSSDLGVYFEISKTGSTRKTIYFLHTFVQTSEEK